MKSARHRSPINSGSMTNVSAISRLPSFIPVRAEAAALLEEGAMSSSHPYPTGEKGRLPWETHNVQVLRSLLVTR